jgi:hypothetical protein
LQFNLTSITLHNIKKGGKMNKSPWSQKFTDQADAITLSLEDQQSEWIRQETAGLLSFVQSERHATLQHAVNSILPRYPNQVYALQLLPVYAVHFDELTHGIMMLAEGDLSAEDLVSEFLDFDLDDQDQMTFFIDQIDLLVELEVAKQAATDETAFKTCFLKQVIVLADIYSDKLAMEDRNGEMSDDAISAVTASINKRIDEALDYKLVVQASSSINHWPMVAALSKFSKNLQILSAQSTAAFAQMDMQASLNGYNDPKLEMAIQYTEAIDAITSYLSNNILTFIEEEIYFLDLGYAMGELTALYGDKGSDPETEWELDENIATQTMYSILSGRYLRVLAEDGIAEQDPVYFQVLQQAIDHLEEVIEEKYPVQQDKKPEFIKEKEARVMETLEQEAQEGDTISTDDLADAPIKARRSHPTP